MGEREEGVFGVVGGDVAVGEGGGGGGEGDVDLKGGKVGGYGSGLKGDGGEGSWGYVEFEKGGIFGGWFGGFLVWCFFERR